MEYYRVSGVKVPFTALQAWSDVVKRAVKSEPSFVETSTGTCNVTRYVYARCMYRCVKAPLRSSGLSRGLD
jgi:hypothetical protein